MGGYEVWVSLPEYAAAWLGYVTGAVIMRLERYDSLRPLLQETWTNPNEYTERVVWLPSSTGDLFGQRLVDGNWLSFNWEHPVSSLRPLRWLSERYPELNQDAEPRKSMAQFDLVMCLYLVLNGMRAVAFYSLGSGGAEELARRIHRDLALRTKIAAVCGVSLEDFDAKAPQALDGAHGFQGGSATTVRLRGC
jgi:hypothetical protein